MKSSDLAGSNNCFIRQIRSLHRGSTTYVGPKDENGNKFTFPGADLREK